MLAPQASTVDDPVLAALRAEVAALAARVTALEGRAAPPPGLIDAELGDFSRLARLVEIGGEFETGDLAADEGEARRLGMLLAKVERIGPTLGLRVESRPYQGRKRWTLRLAGVVDLGGPGSASQGDDQGA